MTYCILSIGPGFGLNRRSVGFRRFLREFYRSFFYRSFFYRNFFYRSFFSFTLVNFGFRQGIKNKDVLDRSIWLMS